MSPSMSSIKSPTILLNESNWNQWRTYIRGRLLTKGIWYVMEGMSKNKTRSGETKDDARDRYLSDSNKAYGIIIEGIEANQYQYIEDAQLATEAFTALSNHHEPKSQIDRDAT
ncbi:hypothetical protein H310_13379 [Aphanomyces invadans]|uniref:DUF4219 domain-containing protein n=1 Tax=Aphanomyces invadans TaxID=157072 RepID=A0A024TDU8_9STRA|nr:hypothetical protein H310_13379 [Aphanomyces invadans]ETV92325.1 hypothetical protein H310_13379 [Aphanomyces invadans]|eukprot:XP_008879076.1 hypothetical protein H310_13379 [Aphanomyces invadans]